jgi:hypothetical protein
MQTPGLPSRHAGKIVQASARKIQSPAKRRNELKEFQSGELQDWEQARRKPAGAALSFSKIAEKRPEVFRRYSAKLAEGSFTWLT